MLRRLALELGVIWTHEVPREEQMARRESNEYAWYLAYFFSELLRGKAHNSILIRTILLDVFSISSLFVTKWK